MVIYWICAASLGTSGIILWRLALSATTHRIDFVRLSRALLLPTEKAEEEEASSLLPCAAVQVLKLGRPG